MFAGRYRGKLLRFNSDGSVPADNYGVTIDGRGGKVLDHIAAYAMCNSLLTELIFLYSSA